MRGRDSESTVRWVVAKQRARGVSYEGNNEPGYYLQLCEMHRVLKPGGRACMAFTNRCYPSKVVPMWLKPFDDYRHCRIVGQYFHYSGGWEDLSVADVSPEGWTGARDPMYVVQARKAGA